LQTLSYTFKKGIHPPQNKLTGSLPIAVMPPPSKVFVPLSQHIGKPAVAVVSAGDTIVRGQLIAKADGFVSANVFSPVCGVVESVDYMGETPNSKSAHIVINTTEGDDATTLAPLSSPSPTEITDRVRDAGIVGMGGAGFPTHVKLSPKEKIDTFIVNGAECEPYITCDHRIMLEYTAEFLRGALYMAAALGIDSAYVGIEDNKQDAINAVETYVKRENLKIKVLRLKSKYPQGAEKQLIYAATGRIVPAGGLPSAVGCVVDNVHTALSTCFAIEKGEPLYKRVMTITGDSVATPQNIWVSVGTKYSDVIEYCGGANKPLGKLISGGPMMGFAVYGDGVSVSKTTSCLLLLSKERAEIKEPSQCINCSRCSSACPMRLMPMFIDKAISAGDLKTAEKYGVSACIECGSCAFVCPASRPLVQTMRLAKKKLREAKK
jgi:electron transport complex protein RnfC